MKKIIIGISALTLITTTIVFANNSNETKKATEPVQKVALKLPIVHQVLLVQ